MPTAPSHDPEETDEHEIPRKRAEPLYDQRDGHYRYERRNDTDVDEAKANAIAKLIRASDRFIISQGIAVVFLLIVIALFAAYYVHETARQDAREQAYLNALNHITDRLDSQKGAIENLDRHVAEYNRLLETQRRR